ncbi:MAG: hypothetical protein IH830_11540 [Planctomycetes bacterium]|nr:hypothetical protein [Planctomycetota bacterium]
MLSTEEFVYQEELLAAWIRRCGERPFRWFLLLWGAIFLVSIPVAFLHFDHKRFSGRPPVPEAVPYAGYLPGAGRSHERTIDLDPQNLPLYDPSRVRQDVGIKIREASGPDARNRVFAWAPHYVGVVGWPETAVTWVSHSAWDVTDPTRPYPPLKGQWVGGFQVQGSASVSFSWVNEDASRGSSIHLVLPGALVPLALPQTLAAGSILWLWTVYRVRHRRRRRRGLCLTCGHQRDPARTASVCPECGAPQPQADASPARPAAVFRFLSTPGRRSLVIFGLMGLAWLAMQGTSRSEQTTQPMKPRVEANSRFSAESGRTYTKSVQSSFRFYGWPIPVMAIQEDHWFTFSPGGPAQRAPCPNEAGTFLRRNELLWILHHEDPSIVTTGWVFWPMVLFQLAIVQITATLISIVTMLTRFRLKRSEADVIA